MVGYDRGGELRMTSRSRSLREKWAEIPFERKIAMFVAPIFVFVITGVVIPRLLDNGQTRVFGKDEQIEVVDVAVINSLDEQTRIEMSVRNIGTTVSVLTHVDFRIESTGYVGPCLAGAPLGVSQTYDLELPDFSRRGEIVPVRISQEIGPDEADRFSFEVGQVTGSGAEPEPIIYQLYVELFHDGKKAPVKAGAVILAEPFPEEPYFSIDFWRERGASLSEAQDCVASNTESVRRVLSREGVRSDELTGLAQALPG
jgi:hypothetical protein